MTMSTKTPPAHQAGIPADLYLVVRPDELGQMIKRALREVLDEQCLTVVPSAPGPVPRSDPGPDGKIIGLPPGQQVPETNAGSVADMYDAAQKRADAVLARRARRREEG